MADFRRFRLDTAWGNLGLKGKGLLVVALPLAALLLVVLPYVLLDAARVRGNDRIRHALVVQGELNRILALLLDAEAGLQAFALTGQEEFLRPYGAAATGVPEGLTALHQVAQVAPEHRELVPRIEKLARAGLESLAALRAAYQGAGAVGGFAPIRTSARTVLAALQQEINAKERAEREQLAQGLARMERVRVLVQATTVSGAVLGLMGGMAAVSLFMNGITRRVQTLAENARRLALEQPLLPIPPHRDEIGRLAGALERAHQLLSERNRERQEARAFLEHVIRASPVLMIRNSPGGEIQWISPNVEQVLGYRPAECSGTPGFWAALIPAADLAALKAAAARALQEGSAELELQVRHRDSSWRWLHTVLRKEDVPGQSPEILSFSVDITARKAAENQLRQAEAEAQRARAEAEAANREKSRFLSRMSHELRTPLNAILGFGQLLELEELGAEAREGVEQILKAGRHLLSLINEVLDIARIEAGQMSLSLEAVRVEDVLAEVADLVRPLAAQRGISVTGAGDGSCRCHVLADRQRLKQVLLNLLSNAIKYNRPAGRVHLTCTPLPGDPARCRISVEDTGPGIAPADQQRLFQPFQRLGAEQAGIEGTGLGLVFSRQLLAAMGGILTLESIPGEGSIFSVELPVAGGPATEDDLPAAGGEPGPQEQAGPPRTVLYIEDNLSNLRLVERILARCGGPRLLAAMQGRLGLELARQHRPDLILLDLNLPDLPGHEVLQRLRADPQTRDIPVVVISADATPGQVERLRAAGARAYVTKPLDIPRFLAVLDEHLNPGRT